MHKAPIGALGAGQSQGLLRDVEADVVLDWLGSHHLKVAAARIHHRFVKKHPQRAAEPLALGQEEIAARADAASQRGIDAIAQIPKDAVDEMPREEPANALIEKLDG